VTLFTDLLHLSRNLRRAPASAIAAVLTLSLTLGAGASIFSVVDAVILTPPPFANPDAVFLLAETPVDDPAAAPRAVAYRTFEAWRERAGSLAAIEALDGTNFTLTEPGAAERISGINVTPGLLRLLGVAPAIGRSFDASDVGQPVAIVSDGFWRRRLGSDPGVIGRRIMLSGRGHTIVGVLPARFFFSLSTTDVWRTFPVAPAEAVREGYRVQAVARLSGQGSDADLRLVLDEVSQTSPPRARAVATPIARAIAGGARRILGVLSAAVALALVIAFTNLAGLLIVRSIDRRRELAVRTALGATRHEIVKQLLLEAVAIVAIGTAGGVILALWMTPVVGRLALQQFAGVLARDVLVSWRVIAALSLLAVGCALVCGSLPALIAARGSAVDVLRARGASLLPRERAIRRASVVGEVALAFVLLMSMTLLGRSLIGVLGVNPGFDPRDVVASSVSLPSASYNSDERVASFYTALQNALAQRLGRASTSYVDEMPLTHDRGRSLVRAAPTDTGREAVIRSAAPDYFEVMRIPIVSGRSFAAGDDRSAPLRVVLSEALARRLFPQAPTVGRQVWLGASSQTAEVIGVVGDVKHRALDDPVVPTVYVSFAQSPSRSSIVMIRSSRPAADMTSIVREEVARLDKDLPVYAIQSMWDVLSVSPGVPERRVLTLAFAGFGGLAVVLGMLGLFGVAAHEVASRRAELALRMAIGADPMRILRMIAGQGAIMIGLGLAAGIVLSIWTARGLSGLLFATGRFDVLSIGAAAITLVAAGAVAILPPALRAARTDPIAALRSE
jgi:putative ABC transport system permease protein